MEKLKVGCVSSASSQVDSEQKITEERVQVEDVCISKSPGMKLQMKDNLYKLISIIIYCRGMMTLLQAWFNMNYW